MIEQDAEKREFKGKDGKDDKYAHAVDEIAKELERDEEALDNQFNKVGKTKKKNKTKQNKKQKQNKTNVNVSRILTLFFRPTSKESLMHPRCWKSRLRRRESCWQNLTRSWLRTRSETSKEKREILCLKLFPA